MIYYELFVLCLRNNMKALKNILAIFCILVILGMSSCVSRVTIPDEEKPVFVIDLQMLRGSDNIFATLHTSNNLNGTYLIDKPETVLIKVQEVNVDNFIQFSYNPDTEVYDYSGSEDFLIPNKSLRLQAVILGEDIPMITSYSKVPMFNELVETELVSESIYKDINSGIDYWQGKIRFNFENLNTTESLFYQLKLKEKLQTKSFENGEPLYTTISQDQNLFEILDVSSGQFAVKEFVDQEGLWIDLDKMDDDYFEIELRSNYPIEIEGQTSDNIFSQVISITEDHYNYYLGLNNIETSGSSLFGEQGLYRTNIEKGFGIFSTCVQKSVEINLAQ
ncbi:MAG: hypothetical protein ACJA1A_002749 [Saprospiraceae bacterium]|jgi:hypothetical protein